MYDQDLEDVQERLAEATDSAMMIAERLCKQVVESATDPIAVALAVSLLDMIRATRRLRRSLTVRVAG